MLQPFDRIVRSWLGVRPVNLLGGHGVKRVVDQCGFARAGYAGDAGNQPYGHINRDVLQIVAARAADGDFLQTRVLGCGRCTLLARQVLLKDVFDGLGLDGGFFRCAAAACTRWSRALRFGRFRIACQRQPGRAFGRHGNRELAAHVLPREGLWRLQQGVQIAMRHHLAAMHACTRPHIDDKVGRADHVFVMLDHQHAVAHVA